MSSAISWSLSNAAECGFEFDLIVDGLDNDFTEGAEFVLVDISGDQAHFVQFGLVTSTQLVEDVETSFSWQLESDTGLFQKICVNVTRGKTTSCSEVDSDEFTETG